MSRNTLSIVVPSALFVALAAALALMLGGWLPFAQASGTATFVQDSISLPDVELTDHHNRKAALVREMVGDDLLVVTFNYTTCESICGVGNAIMQQIDSNIPGKAKRPIRLLSITINPTVDTPQRLADAAAAFEPSDRWLWATGRPADIADILKQSNAQVADIELHELVFIVGDGKRKIFRRLPSSNMTADDLIAALKDFDT
ncbi:MAG: SCO family protein [Rhizobium sp.]